MINKLFLCLIALSLTANGNAAALTGAELLRKFGDSIDRVALDRGEIVWASLADKESKRELVGVMMVQLPAPITAVVKAMQKDRGSSTVMLPVASPSDWKRVQSAIKSRLNDKEMKLLADNDAADSFNLSTAELGQLRKAQDTDQLAAAWSAVLQARAQSYRSKGTAGLAAYVDDDKKHIYPGKQLDEATASMDFLEQQYPTFVDSVAKYPKIAAGLDQQHLFTVDEESGRPLLVLKHRLVEIKPDHALIAERQYYISHSLDVLQVIILFLPNEQGTLMAMLNQTYTGHVAPAIGSSIAHIVGREKVQEKIRPMFVDMQKQFPNKTQK